jgi:hypothetical protein
LYFRNVASLSGNTLLITFTFTISRYSYNLLLWRNKHITLHRHFFLTYLQKRNILIYLVTKIFQLCVIFVFLQEYQKQFQVQLDIQSCLGPILYYFWLCFGFWSARDEKTDKSFHHKKLKEFRRNTKIKIDFENNNTF